MRCTHDMIIRKFRFRPRLLLFKLTAYFRARPRWNGHRPPFGDAGSGRKAEALQNRTASMCQSGASTRPLEERRAQMNATTYGLDVAKQVFQMYWVDGQTGEIANRRLRRDELTRFSRSGLRAEWRSKRAAARTGGHARSRRSGTRWCCCMRSSSDHLCRPTRPMRRMRGQSGRRYSSPGCEP